MRYLICFILLLGCATGYRPQSSSIAIQQNKVIELYIDCYENYVEEACDQHKIEIEKLREMQ